MFVPGKPFQPSPMFVGKAGAYPSGAITDLSVDVVSSRRRAVSGRRRVRLQVEVLLAGGGGRAGLLVRGQ